MAAARQALIATLTIPRWRMRTGRRSWPGA